MLQYNFLIFHFYLNILLALLKLYLRIAPKKSRGGVELKHYKTFF